MTKYLQGLYIDSKFITDESLGSDIWDYADKKVHLFVGIDLGDSKKIFMLSNPLETLAVLACEGWNFDRFDAWAEETFGGSGKNFAVDQKVNFALKSFEHNGAVKFCLLSYNVTGNQSRVLVEDRFSFGDAQGVEIFSDKVI
jgi:hypothetical protein